MCHCVPGAPGQTVTHLNRLRKFKAEMQWFLNEAKKEIVHSIDNKKMRRIRIRKS